MGCINANAYRLGGCIGASAHRVGGISVSVGLICTNGREKYLMVSPTEVQWVTTSMDATYFITSNTDWIVR